MPRMPRGARLDTPGTLHHIIVRRIERRNIVTDNLDRNYVLKWFGKTAGPAKKAYREFVKVGIAKGQRPELVGGGLIRSMVGG